MSLVDPVADAVEKYRGDPSYLVQIVREAQAGLGWIAPATVGDIAARLKIPRTRVESVLQFYSFFYDKPRGLYRVLISDNVTDRMLGSLALFERLAINSTSSAARFRRTVSSASISPPAPACAIKGRRCWSTISRSPG